MLNQSSRLSLNGGESEAFEYVLNSACLEHKGWLLLQELVVGIGMRLPKLTHNRLELDPLGLFGPLLLHEGSCVVLHSLEQPARP